MNDARGKLKGCPAYRARIEGCLVDGTANVDADPALAEHLNGCSACREALEEGLLASDIVRNACEPREGIAGAFVTRVMAAIREEEARRASAGAIWRPIELLASRFALAVSVVLLAASVYLVEFAPPFDMPPTGSQTEIVGLLPEPPAQPSNRDEVLLSLVEMENGY